VLDVPKREDRLVGRDERLDDGSGAVSRSHPDGIGSSVFSLLRSIAHPHLPALLTHDSISHCEGRPPSPGSKTHGVGRRALHAPNVAGHLDALNRDRRSRGNNEGYRLLLKARMAGTFTRLRLPAWE
jgi:hypothetical protein